MRRCQYFYKGLEASNKGPTDGPDRCTPPHTLRSPIKLTNERGGGHATPEPEQTQPNPSQILFFIGARVESHGRRQRAEVQDGAREERREEQGPQG
jgi:hypothetical protein